MDEIVNEAKDFDSMADAFLNQGSDSSTETPVEDVKTEPIDSGAEPVKTEQVKEVEEDTSLSVEDKIAKIKDILGEDQDAIDAYVKAKGYHNDPAWQKQRELNEKLRQEGLAKVAISDEDKAALEEFKTYRSTPEYIQQTMKQQGYTQEAIDKKLQESGFEAKGSPEDDVSMVVSKLGLDINNLSHEERKYVDEVTRIANIIVDDKLSKILPKELAPLQEHIGSITKSENASKFVNTMRETVKTEGILDFSKDVEPELNKFIDANPDATQNDVMEHFRSINHTLTVQRLKTGQRQDERDVKRGNLRQNVPLSSSPKGLPVKTGNFDKDADSFLDSLN